MSALGDRWELRIGDPTVLAWIIVAGYLISALLCFVHARRDRFDGFLWIVLAAMLTLLGINKQLDLQTLLTQFGRDLAREQGWYEQRRVFQAWFIAAVATSGFAGICLLVWLLRGRLWRNSLALLGASFLVCFVLIRAASFHHIDQLLKLRAFRMPLHSILELAGIACIIVAVMIRLSQSSRRCPGVSASTK